MDSYVSLKLALEDLKKNKTQVQNDRMNVLNPIYDLIKNFPEVFTSKVLPKNINNLDQNKLISRLDILIEDINVSNIDDLEQYDMKNIIERAKDSLKEINKKEIELDEKINSLSPSIESRKEYVYGKIDEVNKLNKDIEEKEDRIVYLKNMITSELEYGIKFSIENEIHKKEKEIRNLMDKKQEIISEENLLADVKLLAKEKLSKDKKEKLEKENIEKEKNENQDSYEEVQENTEKEEPVINEIKQDEAKEEDIVTNVKEEEKQEDKKEETVKEKENTDNLVNFEYKESDEDETEIKVPEPVAVKATPVPNSNDFVDAEYEVVDENAKEESELTNETDLDPIKPEPHKKIKSIHHATGKILKKVGSKGLAILGLGTIAAAVAVLITNPALLIAIPGVAFGYDQVKEQVFKKK